MLCKRASNCILNVECANGLYKFINSCRSYVEVVIPGRLSMVYTTARNMVTPGLYSRKAIISVHEDNIFDYLLEFGFPSHLFKNAYLYV